MNDPVGDAFLLAGRFGASSCPDCPGDDELAAWLDQALPATETRRLEDHALLCGHTRQLMAMLAEARVPLETAPHPVVRVLARVKGRALALLNAADLALRELTGEGAPAPAVGALRGGMARGGLVSIQGPGFGLDALDLAVQSDGSVRLTVSGELPDGPEGELRAVLLEADGLPREKRPYTGRPLSLGPLERGTRYRVAVVARRPGEELHAMSEAQFDLSAN